MLMPAKRDTSWLITALSMRPGTTSTDASFSKTMSVEVRGARMTAPRHALIPTVESIT